MRGLIPASLAALLSETPSNLIFAITRKARLYIVWDLSVFAKKSSAVLGRNRPLFVVRFRGFLVFPLIVLFLLTKQFLFRKWHHQVALRFGRKWPELVMGCFGQSWPELVKGSFDQCRRRRSTESRIFWTGSKPW